MKPTTYIRSCITRKVYKVGKRLPPAKHIASKLKTSEYSVKKALKYIANVDRTIELINGYGYYVTPMSTFINTYNTKTMIHSAEKNLAIANIFSNRQTVRIKNYLFCNDKNNKLWILNKFTHDLVKFDIDLLPIIFSYKNVTMDEILSDVSNHYNTDHFLIYRKHHDILRLIEKNKKVLKLQ